MNSQNARHTPKSAEEIQTTGQTGLRRESGDRACRHSQHAASRVPNGAFPMPLRHAACKKNSMPNPSRHPLPPASRLMGGSDGLRQQRTSQVDGPQSVVAAGHFIGSIFAVAHRTELHAEVGTTAAVIATQNPDPAIRPDVTMDHRAAVLRQEMPTSLAMAIAARGCRSHRSAVAPVKVAGRAAELRNVMPPRAGMTATHLDHEIGVYPALRQVGKRRCGRRREQCKAGGQSQRDPKTGYLHRYSSESPFTRET
jgi:hypothetical protein